MADIRDQLLDLSKVRSILGETEPLTEIRFTVGNQIRFEAELFWHFGVKSKGEDEPVDVWVILGGGKGTRRIRLTKECLKQFGAIIGMQATYTLLLPAQLLVANLNYWYREGLKDNPDNKQDHNNSAGDLKVLLAGELGVAVVKKDISPFSSVRLLDNAVDAITAQFGQTEIMVSPHFSHSLAGTYLKLVAPGITREITGTATENDLWSPGLAVRNSLTNKVRTSVDLLVCRWADGGLALDVNNKNGGTWRRLPGAWKDAPGGAAGVGEEIWDWAGPTMKELLGSFGTMMDHIQQSTTVSIAGHTSEVLRDVFTHYAVPVTDRRRVIENMADAEDLTMYEVMCAVLAGLRPDSGVRNVEALARMAGDLPMASASQCDACRRLTHAH